jgi:spermidine/putrescine transport system permease protein
MQVRRRGLDRRATFWLLYLPPLFWLILFFVLPLLLMAAFSFRASLSGGILRPWVPTLIQYDKLFATLSYWRLLGTSILLALGVAICAVILAYPIAYFLVFRAGKRASLYLILLLVPFWTSYLLRVMAWKLMLGSGRHQLLLELWGWSKTPFRCSLQPLRCCLDWSTCGYRSSPPILCFAAGYPSLLELPPTGRSALTRLRADHPAPKLTRRNCRFFMVFIPTVGEYVTPSWGGSRDRCTANHPDFFTKAANWPFGSAMSMVMLALTLTLVIVAVRLVNLRALIE